MLNFAHGNFDWLAATGINGTYTITAGFEVKAIRFYWVGLQLVGASTNSQAVAERRGVGFASNINGVISQQCVSTFSADNSGNADCGSIWQNQYSATTVDGTGTRSGLLLLLSVSSTTFTMQVTTPVSANITIFWEAWGGDDITNVTIGNAFEPATISTVVASATGFEANPRPYSQCVMLAGVQTVNNPDTGQAQDSGLNVGFSTSILPANNITVCGNSDDGSATMDTDGYNYTGECLSMITIAGGNPNARATISAYGTDTFTINWIARATTSRRNIYMAIKGGYWEAGSTTIAGNTLNSTTTLSALPFNIRGISLIGAMKTQSTVATSTANDRIGFGSGLSTTSRNSAAVLDEDATANSEIDTSVYTTQVLVYPSNAGALQTAYDINAISANQIQLITDTAGGVANEWIGYLVFGDKKVTAGTIGHPFII